VISILLDLGLPRSAALILRQASWSVRHVAEIGLSNASDEHIIEYARCHACHIVTLDADFHALLATTGASIPSVLRLRIEGLKGAELADLMQRLWPEISAAMTTGALAAVTGNRVRIKRLPIA
jgi:predicted nuclease of predicted toxin-antitoxin system